MSRSSGLGLQLACDVQAGVGPWSFLTSVKALSNSPFSAAAMSTLEALCVCAGVDSERMPGLPQDSQSHVHAVLIPRPEKLANTGLHADSILLSLPVCIVKRSSAGRIHAQHEHVANRCSRLCIPCRYGVGSSGRCMEGKGSCWAGG